MPHPSQKVPKVREAIPIQDPALAAQVSLQARRVIQGRQAHQQAHP